MKLVEVIRALATSQETYDALMAFAKAIGKEPITAPDRGGFIVNRLLVPYLLDAIRCLEDGLGTVEDIDNGMKLGCGHPMGPLTLLDFVGLDTTYYIANIMFDEFRETRFAPPPLLKRMVLAGHLGKKSGKGFYDYARRSSGGTCSRNASAIASALKSRSSALRLFLEAAILRRPVRIERRVDRGLNSLRASSLRPMSASVSARNDARDDAVRVVGQRLAQVLFRLLVAAAEEPRHLEIPAAERAIGGAVAGRPDRASASSAARP